VAGAGLGEDDAEEDILRASAEESVGRAGMASAPSPPPLAPIVMLFSNLAAESASLDIAESAQKPFACEGAQRHF
jgi:hypothetical protein